MFLDALFKKKETNNIICAEGLMDYIVLDIETTGFSAQNDDIIEIAMIKFENGEHTSSYKTFINPCCRIPERITELTGICDTDVIEAPTIRNVIRDIASFMEDFIIVGHNVTFDLSFIQIAYYKSLKMEKSFQYVDTLSIARNVFPEYVSHKLEFLKEKLNIAEGISHRAMNDVLCTNRLLNSCLSRISFPLESMIETYHYKKPKSKRTFEKVSPTMMKPVSTDFNLAHSLYDKKIVFTGSCINSRECLMQMALDIGALVRTSVSSKTDYLVVGEQDIALVGDDGLSSKEEKAYALNESGKGNVQIINETTFLNLINENIQEV